MRTFVLYKDGMNYDIHTGEKPTYHKTSTIADLLRSKEAPVIMHTIGDIISRKTALDLVYCTLTGKLLEVVMLSRTGSQSRIQVA